jgi:hypothetical protein
MPQHWCAVRLCQRANKKQTLRLAVSVFFFANFCPEGGVTNAGEAALIGVVKEAIGLEEESKTGLGVSEIGTKSKKKKKKKED